MSSPSPQTFRRRQTKRRMGPAGRDSNAIRASVLQTALELGIAQNPLVANWIFNSPLEEEPEDLQQESSNNAELETEIVGSITPALTHSSNTTSDGSPVLSSPQKSITGENVPSLQVHMHKPSVTEPPHVHFDDFSSDNLRLSLPTVYPDVASSNSKRQKSNNLMVRRPQESNRPSSHDDALRHRDSPSPGPVEAGYSSEGQYLSKGKGAKERGRDKSDKKRIKKWTKPAALDLGKGDDRDGECTSDGGYLSASSNKSQGKSPSKSKSRAMAFFRRRPKKAPKESDDEGEDEIPPVPALPVFPKPSSPKPLARNGAPSSPTRPGFSPLTLNLSSPPASPRRASSMSPPPTRVGLASSGISSKSTPASVAPAPKPRSCDTSTPAVSSPNTPLSPSFVLTSPPQGPLTPSKPNVVSSRHHLTIPPPAPPPSQPLPQLPPSPLPSTPSRRVLSPSPVPPSPTVAAMRAPSRPVPPLPVPPSANSTNPSLAAIRPLSPRKGSKSLFRSLSPQPSPPVPPLQARAGGNSRGGTHVERPDREHHNADSARPLRSTMVRQHSAPAIAHASATPTAQRRLHGPQGGPLSPPRPPPDVPLPPAPSLASPAASSRLPTGFTSKFHEHFSSVSSTSHILAAPSSASTSRTPSRSGSSSGPSVHSTYTTSSERRAPSQRSVHDARTSTTTTATGTATDDSQPETGSQLSYGERVPQPIRLVSRFSDASLNMCTRLGRDSVGDEADVDADVEGSGRDGTEADVDDDASYYPSDEKTAGRRTMYLVENGQADGDEIVIAGSHYWGGEPYPPLPARPGPGYF
ncbi:hypothetical protein EDD16DRAFT_1721177 [Pisolithus croceorrhizus]|nr:hypothetical protein EDD16DRAFT_1721177 [Pisolithus croceorrhizus]